MRHPERLTKRRGAAADALKEPLEDAGYQLEKRSDYSTALKHRGDFHVTGLGGINPRISGIIVVFNPSEMKEPKPAEDAGGTEEWGGGGALPAPCTQNKQSFQ